jgi:hypothetical protein
MMKRLAMVGVMSVVLVGLASCSKPPEGQGNQAKPEAAEAQISPELQNYLYVPYNTLNITATDIHDYTRHEMRAGLFGKKGLKYIVDPDVTGKIKVYGHDITWASALDGFCRENGCMWKVADPHTIRISREPAAK